MLTYPLNFTTTLEAAAAVFVSVNSANILANNPSINSITSSGKAIIFNYTSTAPPTIGFTSYPPGTGTGKITGKSFNSAFFESNGNLDRPRTQSIFNFQSPSSSNEEANTSLYNVGNYIVSIRPSIVEPESLNGDLKYRIILRKPDGSVVIYQGVYANSSSTSPEKSVLTFTKTGLGDNAVYDNFIFTP